MYKTDPITEADVTRLLQLAESERRDRGALTQPEMLDVLRGPLEYRDADGVDEQGNAYTKGDVIRRPHEDLEAVLRAMKLSGSAYFDKQRGGWRLR